MSSFLKQIANWEAWPFKLIYAPLLPVWAIHIIRSRAVWFFTSSNPKLTFGGMDGEPKKEMYNLLPPHLYPPTFNVMPSDEFTKLQTQLLQNKIVYPLVVKPEVGCAGILFRKIDTEAELRAYHAQVPVEYIVQQLVLYPIEVSVFYIRHPLNKKGRITGFLHKIPLNVEGNGFNSLEQLILLHPKACKRKGELYSKHKENWQKVIGKGQKYMLSYAANHNRGANFIDLKEHIDDQLVAVFDAISLKIDDFFYGRYDILCNSIAELKLGENYMILEYNGCGAEPNHIYDSGYTLAAAYKEILQHWEDLYQISSYNRTQGIKPWPLLQGIRFRHATRKYNKILQAADNEIK